MNNYDAILEEIFTSIHLITDRKLAQLMLDRSVIVQIVSRSDETKNLYRVSYQGVDYDAYSLKSDSFSPGEEVYMLVPDNNFSNKKILVSRAARIAEAIDTSSGGGGFAFATISVSGQSAIVAETAADTLTIAAGTGITLTTNATTDTLTIAASGAVANDGTLTMATSGLGLGGSATFTANQSGNSSFTVTSNATSSNVASTIVARDAAGGFNVGNITASSITSTNIVATTLTSSTANIGTLTGSLTATNVTITNLTSSVARIATLTGSLTATNVSISTLTASTANIATLTGSLTATNISISTLTSSTANISTLTGSLTASNITITNLTSSRSAITTLTSSNIFNITLTSSTANISTLTGSLTATNVSISTLTSSIANIATLTGSLTATNITATNFTSSVARIATLTGSLTATNVSISTLTSSNVNILNLSNTTLTSSTANITTLTNTNLSNTTLTSSTANISTLTGSLTATNVSISTLTSSNANILNLSNTTLTSSTAAITNLSNTTLTSSTANISTLTGSLTATNITATNFTSSRTAITSLTASNIFNITLTSSTGNIITLTNTNLSNTTLTSSIANISTLTGSLTATNVSISTLTSSNVNILNLSNTTLTSSAANISSLTSNYANLTNINTAQITASSIITAPVFISNIATGTAPFTVSSTTLVTNLNADFLDGEHGAYYLDYNNLNNKPTISDALVTITSGAGLTGTGTFSLNQYNPLLPSSSLYPSPSLLPGSAAPISFSLSHADTSNISTLTASSRTYVSGLTFDEFGHVTALTTASETVSGGVSSVAFSGGSTGLTVTGSPITTAGTITLSGTLGVANGGTGVTSSTGTGSVVLSNSPTFNTLLTLNGALTATNIFATTLTSSIANISTLTSSNIFTTNLTASGNIRIGTGSVSAPSLAPFDDTNTGIYFPTADTIGFVEGGAEVMRISAAGSVSIGSTTSSHVTVDELLTVNAEFTSSPSGNIRLTKNGTNIVGGGSYIQFDTSGAATSRGSFNARIEGIRTTASNGSAELTFHTTHVAISPTAQERMKITSEGNVGIGTSTPSQKLHVVGQTIIDGGTGIASSGVLHVRQKGNTVDDGIAITSGAGTSHRIWKDEVGTLNIGVPTIPRAIVANLSGSFGIGTQTPTTKFDVVYSSTNTNLTAGPGAILDIGAKIHNLDTTTNAYTYLDLRTQAADVRLAGIHRGSNVSDFVILTDTASGLVEGFRLTSNQNVGLGTQTPTTKLEVVGTISGSNLFTNRITASSITSTNIFATTLTSSTISVTTLTSTNIFATTLTSSTINITSNISASTLYVGAGSATTPSISPFGDTNTGIFFPAADTFAITEGGTEVLRINSSGNVGIGTQTPSYKLQVVGDFAATTKSFVIPHPLDASKRLRYSSLEGPENGVYIRGRATSSIILLPDYFAALVDEDSITVHLNPLGNTRQPQIKSVSAVEIILKARWFSAIDCYYIVFAERKDVPRLEVEI